MNHLRIAFLIVFLTGCAGPVGPAVDAPADMPAAEEKPAYPVIAAAPELGTDAWLNTDRPLRLANLRGRVVLLEMWTFDCINCRRVIPSLQRWSEEYGPQGLVVIGNHYPEFEHERSLENLREAVLRLEISYPITQDNEGVNWKAYQNAYWPTLYLIDKKGQIRYRHIGEGAYTETETAIQALLAENS